MISGRLLDNLPYVLSHWIFPLQSMFTSPKFQDIHYTLLSSDSQQNESIITVYIF
jgi:hypothetical protein